MPESAPNPEKRSLAEIAQENATELKKGFDMFVSLHKKGELTEEALTDYIQGTTLRLSLLEQALAGAKSSN